MEIKDERTCLKQLGILAMQSPCPEGCMVIQQSSDKIWQSRCISKEEQKFITMMVGLAMRCPNVEQIVLPRGSHRII